MTSISFTHGAENVQSGFSAGYQIAQRFTPAADCKLTELVIRLSSGSAQFRIHRVSDGALLLSTGTAVNGVGSDRVVTLGSPLSLVGGVGYSISAYLLTTTDMWRSSNSGAWHDHTADGITLSVSPGTYWDNGSTALPTGNQNSNTDMGLRLVVSVNVAPNASTGLSPDNGTVIDLAVTQRLAYAFSDPDPGDSQSKFDLYYKLVSAGTWTTVTQTVVNNYWDAPASTFTPGDWEWQVATYDSQGLIGPRTSSAFFTAASSPGVPSITAPTSGSTVEATATLTWSAAAQTNYQVRRVADLAGTADATTVYYDSGDVVDGTTRSVSVSFPTNNRWEHVQVRVKAAGLWSTWADDRVYVSWMTTGSGTGATTWTGTATGAHTPRGTAAGAILFTGLALGSVLHSGAATSATTWTGTATGTTTMRGAAAGTTTRTGTATGIAPLPTPQSGSGTGATSWVGLATGARTSQGTAAGARTYTGTATGLSTAPELNITVTATLEPRRWVATLPARTKTGTLLDRRWEGSL